MKRQSTYYYRFIGIVIFLIMTVSCSQFEDMNIDNFNSPNVDQVYANVEDFPKLLSGAYNSWWNHCIGASPSFALLPASETMGTGYGSWGAAPYFLIPREQVPNTDTDPVLLPAAASWFGYYQAIPSVNNILKALVIDKKKVILGETDYTESCLAHAYLLQGLLYGHLAMLHDKAFLITEETDMNEYTYNFTSYSSLMYFALSRIDRSINICASSQFTDPIEMLPEVQFDNNSLSEFANSMAARMAVSNARNADETTSIDWGRVYNYASQGLSNDFMVNVKDGWSGLVINRDPWGYHTLLNWEWIRVHQRIINMMAPDDENAKHPWPYGVPKLGDVISPDSRFTEYFSYKEEIPWAKYATSKGYHILTHFRFTRFEALFNYGVGYINFFTKAEVDLIKSEAMLHLNINRAITVELINNTRVTKGNLSPAEESETNISLLEKIYYERFVETMMTYPLISYFDRRRTNVPEMQLFPGTVRQLPIPYHELVLHGITSYSFGGEGNEM